MLRWMNQIDDKGFIREVDLIGVLSKRKGSIDDKPNVISDNEISRFTDI